jgi:Rieske Fe-S protein
VLAAWGFICALPAVGVVVRFITPIKTPELERESLTVAQIGDIPPHGAKIVRFNRDPVIVIQTPTGQFKAFSARCTHLGCVVEYQGNESPPYFSCNCHGSEFDINGRNIEGPASRPLVPIRVSLQNESIVLSKV